MRARLVYVFGLFECDEYYKTHPDPGPVPGRCRLPAIDSETARQVALVGAGTTFFGVFNLFFTGWTIKRFGLKPALFISVFWPAVRLLIQNIGVAVGAGEGIIIIQASQIITIVGGPVGYLLALNSFAAEIVPAAERTATLGRVSGCAMFGTALGYLFGGYLADLFGIAAPFRATLAMFVISCIFIYLFLPAVRNVDAAEVAKTSSLSAFFAPLKLYIPAKWVLQDGRTTAEYGVLLLGTGAFLGVLATGYIPIILQLFATDVLDFGSTENGWLISLNCTVRGIFLTFIFPVIISKGRKWLDGSKGQSAEDPKDDPAPSKTPTATDATIETPTVEGDAPPPESSDLPIPLTEKKEESYRFDLLFTTYSILLDAVLTSLATFVTEGWQLYLVAVILPFASGTGPAAKGTILQMCSPSQRADALSAISLVELVARLATLGVFGMIFAALAEVGRPELTFACNGAVALLAFTVLLFARFPPDGSRRAAEVEAIGAAPSEAENGH